MRKFLLFLLLLIAFLPTFAKHIIGGELRYEFVGPGTSPNTKIYKIILLLVKGDVTGAGVADLAPSYVVAIFDNDNNQMVPGTEPAPGNPSHLLWFMPQDDPPGILPMPIIASPCLTNQPTLLYTYATYSMNVELPDNNNGYTIVHQTCCRQDNMVNVIDGLGATYTCVVPGILQLQSEFEVDNCPKYHLPISVICFNSPFILDFAADDVDGDSLVYSFCDAYNGGLAQNSGYNDAEPPPYGTVTYQNGYTSAAPLGNLANINPQTGIISGTAPNPGNYVVCVCVQAWRNGRLLTTHRKDLLVRVSPCVPTIANPDPGYITCDGFNIQFHHNSSGADNVFWDFGDPTTLADTSVSDNPVYVYADTGIYYVTFIINKGGNCTDTAIIRMGVYPGFFPGFKANAPFCPNSAVQFNDTTISNYGNVDSWSWNFGNNASLADTSHAPTPQYTYPAAGTYHTSLVVTNSNGCIDTVYKDVVINPLPSLSTSPDTSYCYLDSIRITATSNGSVSWSPLTNITGAATATPTVFPPVPTTYFVTATALGCQRKDSVRVTPINDLINSITADPPAICREDTLLLTGNSNHLSHVTWQWSPAASVQYPLNRVTRAYPTVTTTYTLKTKWGNHCSATKTITIPVTALANPQAGPDTAICGGQTTTTLSASGGDTYTWTPPTGLSNPNIPNPVASPSVTTYYIVHVGVNNCSKTKADTVKVLVRSAPPLQVTNDTLICIVDGLQLNATGAGTAVWTPNYNINNTSILNPFVNPAVAVTYHVRLTDIYGCYKDDSVVVNVKPKTVIDAGPDTSICKTEGFVLHTTGDALHYTWTPNLFLSSDTAKKPFAKPLVTTTYQVIGNIGTCSDTSDISIVVAPYPVANAGPDTIVCTGFSTKLSAAGGSHYLWQPPTYLNNPGIANPVVQNPTSTITYTVTVTDTLGCDKAVTDIVKITVIPKLNVSAGKDTTIVAGEPIMLWGSGAENYAWTWMPSSLPNWLSATNIPNPVATAKDNIGYILHGSDINGCEGSDTVNLTVYTIDPSMYVPTAFTPDGDGINDVARPILLGMKSLNYFRIYNRFGELVFETSEKEKGWDGIYNGKRQDPATFVWMAQGVTYKNETKTRKGYVVLIR